MNHIVIISINIDFVYLLVKDAVVKLEPQAADDLIVGLPQGKVIGHHVDHVILDVTIGHILLAS